MGTHQSLWRSGKPIFAGKSYANLSENALFYIGGILKHARTLNAFTNPSINSYKRFTENTSPINIAYSNSNSRSICQIPFSILPKETRIKICFPDAMSNPYLSFAAILMAGLDGIENKIHPGDAINSEINNVSNTNQLCTSLTEALTCLKDDHNFLLKGNVFSKEIINSFIELKLEEIDHYKSITHIAEFDLYYST